MIVAGVVAVFVLFAVRAAAPGGRPEVTPWWGWAAVLLVAVVFGMALERWVA